MRQNKRGNCVIESRSLSNDAMVRLETSGMYVYHISFFMG